MGELGGQGATGDTRGGDMHGWDMMRRRGKEMVRGEHREGVSSESWKNTGSWRVSSES